MRRRAGLLPEEEEGLAVAIARFSADLVRLIFVANNHEELAKHKWIIDRLATIIPALYLALIALFAPDTPSHEEDETLAPDGSGGINSSSSRSDPLLQRSASSIEKPLPRSPEDSASFASKLTFSCARPLRRAAPARFTTARPSGEACPD